MVSMHLNASAPANHPIRVRAALVGVSGGSWSDTLLFSEDRSLCSTALAISLLRSSLSASDSNDRRMLNIAANSASGSRGVLATVVPPGGLHPPVPYHRR